jgi:hypothetical protein
MSRKPDQKQVDAIAYQFGMSQDQRFEFGDYLEACKAKGDRGTKNARGDFTSSELRQKAREFLGLSDEE